MFGLSKIDAKRFLDKININSKSECWNWLSTIDKCGYGVFFYRDKEYKRYAAHRISYMIYHRKRLKSTTLVLHKCDNTKCVNPNHLKLGSHKSNVRDRVKKQRSAVGSEHGKAKINEIQAMEILAYATEKSYSIRGLSKLYGISRKAIRDIRDYKTWRHVI